MKVGRFLLRIFFAPLTSLVALFTGVSCFLGPTVYAAPVRGLATVKGKIIDEQTKAAIVGIRVSLLEDVSQCAFTSSNGVYNLQFQRYAGLSTVIAEDVDGLANGMYHYRAVDLRSDSASFTFDLDMEMPPATN